MVKDEALEWIIDETSDTDYVYFGYCEPGNVARTDQPIWRIYRIVNATLIKQYADGDDNRDNVWDDRETISYGPA